MTTEIRETNVCVIGGAGFLGSHLVDHLIEDRDCRVLVLDNLISGLRKHVHPQADFVWHDIREDEETLVRLFYRYGIRYVFNYAAEPYIPECFDRPMHFFEINATAVLRVLNACQRANIQGILQVSSAEIYGDATGKISEDAPVCAHSTYGVSKLAADGLVRVRYREVDLPAIAMRQFNCIGPRETHEYVVPEIISQLQHGPSARLGNNSVRDFLYAKDAVRMAVLLLEHGQPGEVYNMGSETCIRIYDLASAINAIMNPNSMLQLAVDPMRKRPWEIWHLQSDNTKLKAAIGDFPITPLQTALEETVRYFRDNGCRWDF